MQQQQQNRWKRTLAILLVFAVYSVNCERSSKQQFSNSTSSDTFRVYRVFLRTWNDVNQIVKLRQMAEEGHIDIWLDGRKPGQYLELMLSSSVEERFLKLLAQNALAYKLTIPDVQKLIKEREKEPLSKSSKNTSLNNANEELRSFLQRRMKDSPTDEPPKFVGQGRPFERIGETKAHYFFGQYNSYASMTRYMRTIEFYYPHLARLVRIGVTTEGRPIEGLKIGYPISNTTKRAMWIDGNIHAREWASSHTALFMINQLVSGYGKDKQITHFLNSMNFWIFPNLNPDGYEYSRSSLSPEIRLWRKNRSQEKCVMSAWGGWRCCQGVDLNRNFDFHFGEVGSSTNPCSNLYAGEEAFSEPESKAVANFLQSKNLMGRVDGFISLHTYAQFWIHPFSHELQYYPPDLAKITSVAEKAVSRLRDVYGTEYHVGTGADLLSPASGGSDDWAKEKLGVRYVYLIELRPHNDFSNGFILNQDELLPTGIETFEAIKVVIEAILQDNGISKNTKLFFDETTSRPHTTEESALHLVKSQTTFAPQPMNINLSVTNMLDVNVLSFNNPLDSNFLQALTQSTTPSTFFTTPSAFFTTPSTTQSTTQPSTQTTTFSTTTFQPTTQETTQTTTQETTTESLTTTTLQPSTEFHWPPTPPSAPMRISFPVSVAAVISIINQTDAPTTNNHFISTQSIETTTNREFSTQDLSLTQRQHLSEELLRKQLLRIQEFTSFRRSTQELVTSTTSNPPTTSLFFTSTRRYGPRFLTPPSTIYSRSPTPLSYSTQSATPLPMRLPPIVPPRLGGSVNIQPHLVIAPTSIVRSTTNRPCKDRKYSCIFWISADPYACEDQKTFMQNNCAFSCNLCSIRLFNDETVKPVKFDDKSSNSYMLFYTRQTDQSTEPALQVSIIEPAHSSQATDPTSVSTNLCDTNEDFKC